MEVLPVLELNPVLCEDMERASMGRKLEKLLCKEVTDD